MNFKCYESSTLSGYKFHNFVCILTKFELVDSWWCALQLLFWVGIHLTKHSAANRRARRHFVAFRDFAVKTLDRTVGGGNYFTGRYANDL